MQAGLAAKQGACVGCLALKKLYQLANLRMVGLVFASRLFSRVLPARTSAGAAGRTRAPYLVREATEI
jgi:hypothetical protein